MTAKRLLVTGATRGLGRAIAVLLDELGHRLLLSGRDQEALSGLQQQLRNSAAVVAADLGDPETPQRLIEQARHHLGGLDGLINNAGTIDPIASLQEADARLWARAVEVNLTAPAMLIRAALPELSKTAGRIVNISTGAAVKPMAGWSAYCASKAGLLHLSAVVAAENPEIGCFSLRPGVIDTSMQAAIRDSSGMRSADQQRFLELHRQGGLEPPEVPARAAAWLVLHGPKQRSGQLLDYTDAEVEAGVREMLER